MCCAFNAEQTRRGAGPVASVTELQGDDADWVKSESDVLSDDPPHRLPPLVSQCVARLLFSSVRGVCFGYETVHVLARRKVEALCESFAASKVFTADELLM